MFQGLALVCLVFGAASPAVGLEADEAAQQEIQEQQASIDQAAATEEGAQSVEQQIKDEFVVDGSIISDLRDKKFGYGEITTALALAERMEGGINEENIQRIVDLRSGETKQDWGEIAKQYNISAGDLKNNLGQFHPGMNSSDKNATAAANIKAALDASKPGQPKDSLPVSKNLPDAHADKPASVPEGQ
jgi:hypothetical protein